MLTLITYYIKNLQGSLWMTKGESPLSANVSHSPDTFLYYLILGSRRSRMPS
jgi:hypothetical protein